MGCGARRNSGATLRTAAPQGRQGPHCIRFRCQAERSPRRCCRWRRRRSRAPRPRPRMPPPPAAAAAAAGAAVAGTEGTGAAAISTVTGWSGERAAVPPCHSCCQRCRHCRCRCRGLLPLLRRAAASAGGAAGGAAAATSSRPRSCRSHQQPPALLTNNGSNTGSGAGSRLRQGCSLQATRRPRTLGRPSPSFPPGQWRSAEPAAAGAGAAPPPARGWRLHAFERACRLCVSGGCGDKSVPAAESCSSVAVHRSGSGAGDGKACCDVLDHLVCRAGASLGCTEVPVCASGESFRRENCALAEEH
eukprot:359126-Chlamydomonas_euryale.AAC.3